MSHQVMLKGFQTGWFAWWARSSSSATGCRPLSYNLFSPEISYIYIITYINGLNNRSVNMGFHCKVLFITGVVTTSFARCTSSASNWAGWKKCKHSQNETLSSLP